jgi:hypothetical protein
MEICIDERKLKDLKKEAFLGVFEARRDLIREILSKVLEDGSPAQKGRKLRSRLAKGCRCRRAPQNPAYLSMVVGPASGAQ